MPKQDNNVPEWPRLLENELTAEKRLEAYKRLDRKAKSLLPAKVPAEILLEIFKKLDQKAVFQTCLVNRAIHIAFQPLLGQLKDELKENFLFLIATGNKWTKEATKA